MIETITNALIAGVVAGVGPTAAQAVGDAYRGLKTMLILRLGLNSDAVTALDRLEKQPGAETRKASLREDLTAANLAHDGELIAAAQRVLEAVKDLPEAQQANVQNAIGSNIAQADRGSTAKVVVGRPT
jgi:hypothetical protein